MTCGNTRKSDKSGVNYRPKDVFHRMKETGGCVGDRKMIVSIDLIDLLHGAG